MQPTSSQLIPLLKHLILEKRSEKLESVLAQRTRYLTVVVEDIYQPHNMSAVLRSCEAFGVQNIHVVEDRNPMQIAVGIALGSNHWLTVKKYSSEMGESIQTCAAALKKEGYRIVATAPEYKGKKTKSLADFPLDQKIALMFGTEKDGLTPEAMECADHFLHVPMHGFVESLNISVSAAICLEHLTSRLRKEVAPEHWKLNKEEYNEVFYSWLCKEVSSDPDERKLILDRLKLDLLKKGT